MSVARPLILASSSPRRLELLARLGVVPDQVVAPDVDESPIKQERPRDLALRLATMKAHAVQRPDGTVVLAADTVVVAGRRLLGKPLDEVDQRRMLGLLSGRRHHCLSAICVIDAAGIVRARLSDTIVTFKSLNTSETDRYVASGEGLGKAGGYAIQGFAEAFVRYLAGSHSGVVGLPLFETRALLAHAEVILG